MKTPDSLNAGEPGRKEDQYQRYSKHSLPHSATDLRAIAHALGGDVADRNTELAPGPGHSTVSRSAS